MISHPFPYRLIRSNRKTLAIQVSVSGQVIVRAPRTMSDSTIVFSHRKKAGSWNSSPAPLPYRHSPLLKIIPSLISAAAIIWNLPAKYSKEKPQPTPEKWT